MNIAKTYYERFYHRLTTDNRFLAFYLNIHLQQAKVDLCTLSSDLGIQKEAVFKLGICKAPLPNESDFQSRVRNISNFVGARPKCLEEILSRTAVLKPLNKECSARVQKSLIPITNEN